MHVNARDARVGDQLPPVEFHVTFEKVVMTPLATWDMFPGHNDPSYARTQGQKSIYLNTVALQGLADRLVTDWAGPAIFIARRKLTMMTSAFPGDTLVATGSVGSVRVGDGLRSIDLNIILRVESRDVCIVETTVTLPLDPADRP